MHAHTAHRRLNNRGDKVSRAAVEHAAIDMDLARVLVEGYTWKE